MTTPTPKETDLAVVVYVPRDVYVLQARGVLPTQGMAHMLSDAIRRDYADAQRSRPERREPKETVRDCLLAEHAILMHVQPYLAQDVINIRAAIAWIERLQAESDAEKVRAFVAGATWAVEGTRVAEFEHPESVARRLLAEGKL